MIGRVIAAAAGVFLLSALSGCGHSSWLPAKHAAYNPLTKAVVWTAGPAELALDSGGKVSVPAGADYLLGIDAMAYSYQTTGSYSDTAEVLIRLENATLRIDYRNSAYIPEGDYCHLDLERAKAGTQARIAARNSQTDDAAKKEAMGLWIMPPRYDRASHELTFGRLVGTNARPVVNLFVAKLVRRGLYLATWSGTQQDAPTALLQGHVAKQILDSLQPAPNDLYEQHTDREPLAGFTIAGFWDTPETAPAYANVPQDCE